MKKRIGILTLHRALNYGAVWQCWALKHACESLDYDVETIDYNPFGHYTYKGLLRHRPDKALAYIRNFRFFNEFVDNMLNPTTHTENHEWIKNNPPKDDIYIVGSDTVWSEAVVGNFLNSYMLDFAPKSVRRIAYAPSLGGVLPTSNIFAQELPKFHAVSIREPQFISEVSELYNKAIVDVCDPSLLITADDYVHYEKRKRGLPSKYIAVFEMAGDSYLWEIAEMIKRIYKIPIVHLGGSINKKADVNFMGIKPTEWIYIIRNAQFVCTNGFHGTVFSIIFRRPFVTCPAKIGGRAKTNGRVENLLSQCGLMKQYITDISNLEDALRIDYARCNDKIEFYRTRSLEWLKNALEQ